MVHYNNVLNVLNLTLLTDRCMLLLSKFLHTFFVGSIVKKWCLQSVIKLIAQILEIVNRFIRYFQIQITFQTPRLIFLWSPVIYTFLIIFNSFLLSLFCILYLFLKSFSLYSKYVYTQVLGNVIKCINVCRFRTQCFYNFTL